MLVRRSRVYVFACICMYWCCIFDFFSMYFVCIVCIWQNVSVSMRLATFGAENTSKYIQYRQIQISYIHQFYQNTYKNTYKISQLLCVCMCMYLHVYACIMYVCLYFMHPKTWSDVHVVCACIYMYLYVSGDCHCSQVVVCVQLGYMNMMCCRANDKGPFVLKFCFIFQRATAG